VRTYRLDHKTQYLRSKGVEIRLAKENGNMRLFTHVGLAGGPAFERENIYARMDGNILQNGLTLGGVITQGLKQVLIILEYWEPHEDSS
jgi:hypothetical protein